MLQALGEVAMARRCACYVPFAPRRATSCRAALVCVFWSWSALCTREFHSEILGCTKGEPGCRGVRRPGEAEHFGKMRTKELKQLLETFKIDTSRWDDQAIMAVG